MNTDKAKPVIFFLLVLMVASCSSTEPFSGFSYDPAGATETSDKPISSQHKRTIGIAEDGIWISNEFSGARMSDFYKVDDSLYQIVIAPENAPINNSPWYSFKVWADTTKDIQLKLSYKEGEHRYIPEISENGRSWAEIDSSRYSPDTLAGTATLSLSLSSDTLWVSGQELITQSLFNHWADSLAKKAYVRQDTIGYSHQKRPIRRLTVTETGSSKPHGVLIITSRLHPPEVTGQIAALEFIEELSADSELAGKFRKHFEVVAYPFANPDGVENGHWRHNTGGVDLNRDWQSFNQPETKAIRDNLLNTVKKDTLKRVFYGIDFHSTDENIFYPINRDIKTFPDDFSYRWLAALDQAFPGIAFAIEPFDTSSPITKNWIHKTFGSDALTYEVNDTMQRELIDKTSRKAARLLMEMLLEEFENIEN